MRPALVHPRNAWSGEGCDIGSYEFTRTHATMLPSSFGILTCRSDCKGSCFGQELWPISVAALYARQGNEWLWHSGINVPTSPIPQSMNRIQHRTHNS